MTSLSQSSGEAGGHQPSSLPSLSTPYQLVVSEVKVKVKVKSESVKLSVFGPLFFVKLIYVTGGTLI